MPTNLPPEALEAEKRYRDASSTAEKIRCLEEYVGLIPKHKGTDKLRADLRRRLSKLKSASQTRKGVSRWESAFHIEREGAGQAVVIGPSNVGKSALVAALTNATPEVSDAPFTTWQPLPGMMLLENVQIQLVDTPPLDRGFVEPELMDLIRRADILLLMVDLEADPFQQLDETVNLLHKHRIASKHWEDRKSVETRLTYVPMLVLANKCDDDSDAEDCKVFGELLEEEWPLLAVSAKTGRNLERLKRTVFDWLGIIRVYSKPPGAEPNLSAPFILEKGSTVADFAGDVHQDFFDQLKMARIWGSGAFDGQLVSRDHVLQDGDVVELRL